MATFYLDQFVIVNDDLKKDELAYVSGIPFAGAYEVSLISEHRVTSGLDLVYCSGTGSLRAAIEQEILEQKRLWEEKNNHQLPFKIVTNERGCFIAA